jgi:hypothetical protein
MGEEGGFAEVAARRRGEEETRGRADSIAFGVRLGISNVLHAIPNCKC